MWVVLCEAMQYNRMDIYPSKYALLVVINVVTLLHKVFHSKIYYQHPFVLHCDLFNLYPIDGCLGCSVCFHKQGCKEYPCIFIPMNLCNYI